MREVVTMWGNTRMVVLAALTAALYAAVLIPFKVATIIPGFTEVRPGAVVPLVFGYLFGPAGAWGSGMGNVIGDFLGGTLSLGTAFGFAGNFLLALVPYKLLGAAAPRTGAAPASPWRETLLFAAAIVPASAACAATIGWGVDLLGLVPFSVLGAAIFVNNLVVGLALGPVLLRLVHPRVAAWHLLWTDVMDSAPAPAARRRLGAALIWAGALGALAAGFAFPAGVAAAAAPLLLLLLAGALLA